MLCAHQHWQQRQLCCWGLSTASPSVWGLQVPLMTIEGNHEIENDAAGKTFLSYTARYRMPAPESNSTSQLYYSFDTGGEAVLHCSCTTDLQGCSISVTIHMRRTDDKSIAAFNQTCMQQKFPSKNNQRAEGVDGSTV